jgi:hypothetical protein
MESRKIAAIFAYIGGTLLLIAGATGSTGIIGTIIEYLIENLGGVTADLLSLILQALNFVADIGGISVIIGGSFIINQRTRIGKFIIGIGAGMGLIGFLIILASAFLHGWVNAINFIVIISQSIGWIGIILSIAATILAK